MVYALITLYNPDLNVYRNIIQISKQVDHVYLCDNSSERNVWNFESNNITYLYNKGENLGISLAYNKILTDEVKYSFRMEDYILFFDQDTYVPNDHVNKLVCEYENICQNRKVGCLGPVFINEVTGQKELPRIKKYINDNTFLTKSVITSSMLTKYKVLKEIDFFNSNLFLDFVDFDLCWRMMQKGYICCMSDVSIMCHSVGIAQIQLLGDKIYIELTGNGFLYNMVRIIAGTLVEVGLEKIEPEKIEEIIKEGKRENAGKTLPPNGLYLVDVKYE